VSVLEKSTRDKTMKDPFHTIIHKSKSIFILKGWFIPIWSAKLDYLIIIVACREVE
jgi:hypothetical protein